MKMCTVYEIRDCELMRIMRRSTSSNDDFVPIQLQQQRLRRSSSFQNGGGVRRALFRERIDHEATDRYLRLQMSEIHAEARSRWNFDFGDDVPLLGRYEWTPVTTNKVRDDFDEDQDLDRSDREVKPKTVVVVDATSSHDGGETELVKANGNVQRKNTVQTKMTDFAKQRKRPSSLSLKSSSSRPPSFSIDTTTSLISKKLRRLASSCADDNDDVAPSSSWVAAAAGSSRSSSSSADGGKSPSLAT